MECAFSGKFTCRQRNIVYLWMMLQPPGAHLWSGLMSAFSVLSTEEYSVLVDDVTATWSALCGVDL